jgi:hypothetical protein
MKRLILVLSAMVLMLILPATVLAANSPNSDEFMLKVGGTTTIGSAEQLDSAVFIDGDAIIDGTIEDSLWVISGNVTINGRVSGEITVIDGVLTLGSTATVKNVSLIRSDLVQDPSAAITGKLSERSEFVNFGWGREIFSFAFWIGSTIAILVAGLLFTLLAKRHVISAAGNLSGRPVESIISALILWIGTPIVAILSILTIIGIPLGIMLLLSLPLIWIAGYTVAGMLLGQIVGPRVNLSGGPEHAYRNVIIGIILFQIIGLVPFVGGLIVAVAGFVGSGALVYLASRGRSVQRASAVPVPVPSEAAPAA